MVSIHLHLCVLLLCTVSYHIEPNPLFSAKSYSSNNKLIRLHRISLRMIHFIQFLALELNFHMFLVLSG